MDPQVTRWAPLILVNTRMRRLSPSLVAGLIAVESSGNPDAISKAGAVGLMQVMPDTAIPGRPTKAQLLQPHYNIGFGCGLLADFRTQYKTQAGMLAAYFGAVDAAGHPTNASDGSGVTGWGYVSLVETAALDYTELDQWVDDDFKQYAPSTHTWREVAINLKGVCDDALETGRKMRDVAAKISNGMNFPLTSLANVLVSLGGIQAGAKQGQAEAQKIVDTWGTR